MAIRDRSAWNARAPRSTTPRPLSHFGGIRVHHSGGSGSTSVRGIQNWDMDQRGLPDIGYSYVIRDGEVYEGRGTTHPAHDRINATFGVCIIGTYTGRLPSAEDLDALVACIRELREMTGRTLPVDGHRDAEGASTACPGDALHAHLPEIRRRADDEGDDVSAQDVWSWDPNDLVPGAIRNRPWRGDADTNVTVKPSYALEDTWDLAHEARQGVAELLELVRGLAAGHELTAEQIEAAAKRGAEAALDPTELGEAIAAHLGEVPPEQVQAAVQAGVREVLGGLDEG